MPRTGATAALPHIVIRNQRGIRTSLWREGKNVSPPSLRYSGTERQLSTIGMVAHVLPHRNATDCRSFHTTYVATSRRHVTVPIEVRSLRVSTNGGNGV